MRFCSVRGNICQAHTHTLPAWAAAEEPGPRIPHGAPGTLLQPPCSCQAPRGVGGLPAPAPANEAAPAAARRREHGSRAARTALHCPAGSTEVGLPSTQQPPGRGGPSTQRGGHRSFVQKQRGCKQGRAPGARRPHEGGGAWRQEAGGPWEPVPSRRRRQTAGGCAHVRWHLSAEGLEPKVRSGGRILSTPVA